MSQQQVVENPNQSLSDSQTKPEKSDSKGKEKSDKPILRPIVGTTQALAGLEMTPDLNQFRTRFNANLGVQVGENGPTLMYHGRNELRSDAPHWGRHVAGLRMPTLNNIEPIVEVFNRGTDILSGPSIGIRINNLKGPFNASAGWIDLVADEKKIGSVIFHAYKFPDSRGRLELTFNLRQPLQDKGGKRLVVSESYLFLGEGVQTGVGRVVPFLALEKAAWTSVTSGSQLFVGVQARMK